MMLSRSIPRLALLGLGLPLGLGLLPGSSVAQVPEWTERQALDTSTPEPDGGFGLVVALDDDQLAIGSGETGPTSASPGQVHLFEQVGGQWVEAQVLTPPGAPNALSRFGSVLSLDGGRLAVGDPMGSAPPVVYHGLVHVYVSTPGGWQLEAELSAPDASSGDRFGQAVDLDGDRLAITATADRTSRGGESGSVYYYERLGGEWVLVEKVLQTRSWRDLMGEDVELRGSRLHVRSWSGSPMFGSQYVHSFRRTNGEWREGPEFLFGAGPPGGISLSGDLLAVADPPGVFVLDVAVEPPVPIDTVAAPPGTTEFGRALALDGDRLLVGGVDAVGGCVHVFRLSPTGTFEHEGTLRPGIADPSFGQSLAMDGVDVLTGAPDGVGRAYVHEAFGAVGSLVCPGSSNSTGASADLTVTGSQDVGTNALHLAVEGLPGNQFGYFLSGPNTTLLPVLSGVLCIAHPMGRHNDQVLLSGVDGRVARYLDLGQMPTPLPPGTLALAPGDVWTFQYWYRDVLPSGNTGNFSSAIQVAFQ